MPLTLRFAGAESNFAQAGKNAVVLEPAHVGRVAGEHGARVIGWSTRGTDDGADEALDERRLGGAGRAANHDQRLSVQLPQTREHVVVHLGDEVVPYASRCLRSRDARDATGVAIRNAPEASRSSPCVSKIRGRLGRRTAPVRLRTPCPRVGFRPRRLLPQP